MPNTEQKLTLLATVYGRHPYDIDGRYGFYSRDEFGDLYPSLDEAIKGEAKRIRGSVVLFKGDTSSLREELKKRQDHLRILEG